MLKIEDLNTYYGDSHILRGVDVEIPAATSVGLLGRNGMGKTTLIRSLMGYVRPASGRVRLDEQDVTGWTPEKMARRGIGYVPEGRGIFPNLSVRENLLMSARAGIDGRRDWTFERVMATFPRLTERLSHGGQQLSGGEQQMLSIGRALMTNPRLLILDEATEGLAPLIVIEIWRVIADIRTYRHRHADRRPRLAQGARAHRPGGGDGEGAHRARRGLGRADGGAEGAGGVARGVMARPPTTLPQLPRRRSAGAQRGRRALEDFELLERLMAI